ncbi:MAG: hypothetical protein AVDCRST_MAG66-544, partial [uncultured Pseudonocardia sp.]
ARRIPVPALVPGALHPLPAGGGRRRRDRRRAPHHRGVPAAPGVGVPRRSRGVAAAPPREL